MGTAGGDGGPRGGWTVEAVAEAAADAPHPPRHLPESPRGLRVAGRRDEGRRSPPRHQQARPGQVDRPSTGGTSPIPPTDRILGLIPGRSGTKDQNGRI